MQNTLISPSLEPAWHKTVAQQKNCTTWCVCTYVYACMCVCVRLSMHTVLNLPRERIHSLIKYSPPTTGSQLPAAIMHTHCRVIGAWCIHWKLWPIKSLNSPFWESFFKFMQLSFKCNCHAPTPGYSKSPTYVPAGWAAKLWVQSQLPGVDQLTNMRPAHVLPEYFAAVCIIYCHNVRGMLVYWNSTTIDQHHWKCAC